MHMTKERAIQLLNQFSVPLALLWLELVFKLSTTGGLWPQMLFVLLFCVAAGLFVELLAWLLPSAKAAKITKVVLMGLAGVVFCVEYFVYRQFKLFYDLNTVLGGAADAATGFTDQIFALVFSPAGLLHIALFALPAVAYALWGTSATFDRSASDALARFVHAVRNCALAWIVALLAVTIVPAYQSTYSSQYTFEAAVTNFGLITGLRKEVMGLVLGNQNNVSFTTQESPDDLGLDLGLEAEEDVRKTEDKSAQDASSTSSSTTTKDADKSASKSTNKGTSTDKDSAAKNTAKQKPQAKKSYGTNALKIDFDELASTSNGTWAELDRYVLGLSPSKKNAMTGRFAGYNLIFVSAEALSAEAIRKDTTPTLWRMAHKGIQFTDYYQFDSAGTTGGECANLFGLLPTEGGNSVKGTATHNNYYTMGNALNRLGYNGWAFHNNTYTYYSRDVTHNNLGYNNGYMGYGNGMEKWVTWQWPQSDLQMVKGTFDHLYGKKAQEPFNVYYMSVSGHSGYGPADNSMSQKHWSKVEDLPYSDPVKGYLACNIELDRAMKYLIRRLKKLGMDKRTVIVLGADHFPYGLDDDSPLGSLPYTSELYGYDIKTYFQRDHNRLIVWSGSLEDEDPIVVDSPVGAIDILPTLLNLFGCEWDSRLLPGRDVFSNKPALVFNLSYDWKSDLGTYYAGSATFEPNKGAKIPKDYVAKTNADVANRINYCRGVLTSDYYRHVFGDPQDVNEVHDAAVAARKASVAKRTGSASTRNSK